jgi:hypothetical protein
MKSGVCKAHISYTHCVNLWSSLPNTVCVPGFRQPQRIYRGNAQAPVDLHKQGNERKVDLYVVVHLHSASVRWVFVADRQVCSQEAQCDKLNCQTNGNDGVNKDALSRQNRVPFSSLLRPCRRPLTMPSALKWLSGAICSKGRRCQLQEDRETSRLELRASGSLEQDAASTGDL